MIDAGSAFLSCLIVAAVAFVVGVMFGLCIKVSWTRPEDDECERIGRVFE